jgi:hypothetical protein
VAMALSRDGFVSWSLFEIPLNSRHKFKNEGKYFFCSYLPIKR